MPVPQGWARKWNGRLARSTGCKTRHDRSKAIDMGDPASAWANEPEPNGGRVNLGAYGNTPWATLSPYGFLLMVK